MPSSDFSPYEVMLERAETPRFRALINSLIATSASLKEAEKELPQRILEGRSRREGKPVKLTKGQSTFLTEADNDAVLARTDLERSYRQMHSEREMIECALASEKFHFETWAWLYDSVHANEKPFAERIRDLQKKLIEDMETFLKDFGPSKPSR
jgi:hypothetical protein